MKTKKLEIKKQTISNLNSLSLRAVKGGTSGISAFPGVQCAGGSYSDHEGCTEHCSQPCDFEADTFNEC